MLRLETASPHRVVRVDSALLLAKPAALEAAAAILESGRTLFDYAAGHPGAERLDGRGPVYVIPCPDPPAAAAGEGWVVRHYRRGGAMARFLDDRYLRLGRPRPVREADASHAARLRGVPTPEVLAAAIYPTGAFYRADLVTGYIRDSMDLAHILFDRGAATAAERVEACRAAASLLARLHGAGVIHRDLNLKNVLIARAAREARAYLLDLDRCRVAAHVPGRARRAMRARFRRSLTKWERRTGRRIAAAERAALGLA